MKKVDQYDCTVFGDGRWNVYHVIGESTSLFDMGRVDEGPNKMGRAKEAAQQCAEHAVAQRRSQAEYLRESETFTIKMPTL